MSPSLERHLLIRATPRPDNLAFDEKGARPHARSPELAPLIGVGDEKFAIDALEKKVRVTARKQASGCHGSRGGTQLRFIPCEDPRVADRGFYRDHRLGGPLLRRDATLPGHTRPYPD